MVAYKIESFKNSEMRQVGCGVKINVLGEMLNEHWPFLELQKMK